MGMPVMLGRLLRRSIDVGVGKNVNHVVVFGRLDGSKDDDPAEVLPDALGELLQLGAENGAAAVAMMTSTISLGLSGDFVPQVGGNNSIVRRGVSYADGGSSDNVDGHCPGAGRLEHEGGANQ